MLFLRLFDARTKQFLGGMKAFKKTADLSQFFLTLCTKHPYKG
jgi:hypothetical protein